MKKSKHFRKDVILARIIAAVLLIVLIILLVTGVSLLSKPSGEEKDTQNSQNTEHHMSEDKETQESEIQEDSQQASESEEENSEEEPDINTDTTYVPDKVYVETTAKVRLRIEPNTNCATLDRINSGTKLEVLETLDGWYKVNYNGQDGYISATYAEIVEE